MAAPGEVQESLGVELEFEEGDVEFALSPG